MEVTAWADGGHSSCQRQRLNKEHFLFQIKMASREYLLSYSPRRLLLSVSLLLVTMVSAELVDALVSPATTLNALFQKVVADGNTDDFPSIVNQRFSSIFAGDALDQVCRVSFSVLSTYEPNTEIVSLDTST